MTTAREQAQHAAEGDASSRLIERLASQLGGHARVQAVYGDPVERDGITVIPVARVRWGVGGGQRRDHQSTEGKGEQVSRKRRG